MGLDSVVMCDVTFCSLVDKDSEEPAASILRRQRWRQCRNPYQLFTKLLGIICHNLRTHHHKKLALLITVSLYTILFSTT